MSTRDELPVAAILGPKAHTPEHGEAVRTATRDIIQRLNDTPMEATMPVIVSVLVSWCANQVDPLLFFEAIGRNSAARLAEWLQTLENAH